MSAPKVQRWKVLESEQVFETPYMRVRRDTCQLPDRTVIDDYFVIERSDVVGIIPITEDNRVVLNRQYKHGISEIVLEIPAGMVDEGETPEEAARRELEEETGYKAQELIPVASLIASPTSENNRFHVFVAPGVTPTGSKDVTTSREVIENELVPLSQLEQLVRTGKINVIWSIAAIHAAQPYIQEHYG